MRATTSIHSFLGFTIFLPSHSSLQYTRAHNTGTQDFSPHYNSSTYTPPLTHLVDRRQVLALTPLPGGVSRGGLRDGVTGGGGGDRKTLQWEAGAYESARAGTNTGWATGAGLGGGADGSSTVGSASGASGVGASGVGASGVGSASGASGAVAFAGGDAEVGRGGPADWPG